MVTFIDLNKHKKDKVVFDKPGDYVAFMHNQSRQITFDITSQNVNLQVYGIFIGRDKDVFDLSSIQHHKAPHSKSNLTIKGVFYDEAKFVYKGLIRIEKNAKGTTSFQKNQNLKLSPKAFVESDPHLEILTNDVKCGHGSSTGKLNEEDIYYLKSRGLTKKTAEKLLIEGFLNEILGKVEKFGISNLISKYTN